MLNALYFGRGTIIFALSQGSRAATLFSVHSFTRFPAVYSHN